MMKPSPTTINQTPFKINNAWFDDYHDMPLKDWEEVSPEDYGYLWKGQTGSFLYLGIQLPSKETHVSLDEHLEKKQLLITNHLEKLYFSGELESYGYQPNDRKMAELEKNALTKISKIKNTKSTRRVL